MQNFLTLAFLTFSLSTFGQVLPQRSLILTHTSYHYHTDPETVVATRNLIEINEAPVIALAQNPLFLDKKWYGLPIDKIQFEFYSHAGEHSLTFPKYGEEFEVTVAGGYFSACLGRTISTLIRNFINDSGNLKSLNILVPMSAVYTGFISVDQRLVPSTPYEESILDSSMDGLNLREVLNHLKAEELILFFQETIDIAVFQKDTMIGISPSRFTLEVWLNGKMIYTRGTGNKKKIKLLLV